MTSTHFYVKDAEALPVAVRYAEARGCNVLRLMTVNDGFILVVSGVLDINSETDLKPYKAGVDRTRVYWSEIVTIDKTALRYIDN